MPFRIKNYFAWFLLAAGSMLLATGPADTRAAAWDALRARTPEAAHLNHALAVEAIMREFAGRNDDADQWALAGLVHDIDIDSTARDLSRHGIVAEPILRNLGISETVIHAVKAHDDHTGLARTSRLDHALYCSDQMYWLIVGASISFPSEKLRAAVAEDVWERIEAKAGKVTAESAQIGLTAPQVLAAALSGMRKAADGLRF
jgi:predicted hydrolase (HD superfamily)